MIEKYIELYKVNEVVVFMYFVVFGGFELLFLRYLEILYFFNCVVGI